MVVTFWPGAPLVFIWSTVGSAAKRLTAVAERLSFSSVMSLSLVLLLYDGCLMIWDTVMASPADVVRSWRPMTTVQGLVLVELKQWAAVTTQSLLIKVPPQ